MKKTIRIMMDFLRGPIWDSDIDTGIPFTGIAVVDSDPIVRQLNIECAELFNSYYHFDEERGFWTDVEKAKEEKTIILEKITRLITRLEEINDGSYEIDDRETERLR